MHQEVREDGWEGWEGRSQGGRRGAVGRQWKAIDELMNYFHDELIGYDYF